MPKFVNTTGYLNDSPHKNNPFNIIKSKTITMNNVNIPLLLRPNKGKPVIAMPNSGEYVFPKADYVFEKPIFQNGSTYSDCPEGFVWSVADQQCLPADQAQASNFSGNKNTFITGVIDNNNTRVGGVGAQYIQKSAVNPIVENQNSKLKRVFGTPNIPAITASNLLGFGLATFANNIEQNRQKAFAMGQMNNPLFNGSYSNAQNDFGTNPYEQTGQLRQQFQKGGIRDYLYSKGIDGSYENRKKLFSKYFTNYTGSAEQNMDLMKKLQSGEIKLNNQQPVQKRYVDNIPKSLQKNTQTNSQVTPFLNINPPQQKQVQKTPAKQQVQKPVQQNVRNNFSPVLALAGSMAGANQKIDNTKINITKQQVKPQQTVKPQVKNEQQPIVVNNPREKAALGVASNILKQNNFKPVSTGNVAVDYYINEIIKNGGKKILITDRGTKKTYYGTPDNIKSFTVLTGKNDNPYAAQDSLLGLREIEQIEATKGNADIHKVTPLGKFKITRNDNVYGAPGLRLGNSSVYYHTVYPGELRKRTAAINSATTSDNNMSYGCINCKKEDINSLTNMFSTGDEGYTIDSRLPISEIEKVIKTNKFKKAGGFFQRGGTFNPISFLYGDDDSAEKQTKAQQNIIAKKQRVTEEDVNSSENDLKLLGLSEEDILNMEVNNQRKNQSYNTFNIVNNSNGINPSVLKTQKDIFNMFPNTVNLGIWGDKSHQLRKSDHNTGDAQDFGVKDIESGNKITEKLTTEAKDRNIKYIIFNNKIWNTSSNKWKPYKGSNPHKGHVHVSYNKDMKMYEQGGEFVVDFATMKELQSKGIKFKIL